MFGKRWSEFEQRLARKIQEIVKRGHEITEDDVRLLSIHVRKHLEFLSEQTTFATLNLFCNWAMHTQIMESLSGLQTLARVNDALVNSKTGLGGILIKELYTAIGFNTLRSELIEFYRQTGIVHQFDHPGVWVRYVQHLIEIIRDVPIEFPPLSKLSSKKKNIYDQIAQNPISPGAGVISIALSHATFTEPTTNRSRELLCVRIRLENGQSLVAPIGIFIDS